MPSTYTPNLRLELQATGENRSTWGVKANNDFSLIETAIAGYSSVAMADANVTLTAVNGAADQSRAAILNLTGVHTAIRTVTIPSVSKVYFVRNSTTGGFAVNVKTSAGNTTAVPTGKSLVLFCDGTNCTSSFVTAAADLTGTVPVINGGTGGADAATARTNLGLVIGTNVQAYDAGLNSIAGLTPAANQMLYTSGTNVYAAASLTPYSRTLLDDADAATWRATLGITEVTEIPSGSKMLFQQTSAPTGWTKDVTHNNKALRVVTGTASSGGSVAFTTAFASQAVTGSNAGTVDTGTVGGTTLTDAQMPSHTHTFSATTSTNGAHNHAPASGTNFIANGGGGGMNTGTTSNILNTSSVTTTNGDHTHTVSGTTSVAGADSSHTHSLTMNSHTHTFTGNSINLAVQYVDLIIATKD